MTNPSKLPEPSGSAWIRDVAGLGTVATSIIQGVSNAIGTVYRPRSLRDEGRVANSLRLEQGKIDAEVAYHATVRQAEAKAEAARIELDSAFDLRQRAVRRLGREVEFEQGNIESIVDQAIERTLQIEGPDQEAAPPPDLDWTMKFIEYAKGVSNAHIQSIWAEILLRQAKANTPRISLMTLDRLRLVEYRHAKAFEWAARMYATFGASRSTRGQDFSHFDYKALDELGFIRSTDTTVDELNYTDEFALHLVAGDGAVPITFDDLTMRGRELADIIIPGFAAFCASVDTRQRSTRYTLLSVEQQAEVLADIADSSTAVGGQAKILIPTVANGPCERVSHTWDAAKKGWLRASGASAAQVPPEIKSRELHPSTRKVKRPGRKAAGSEGS